MRFVSPHRGYELTLRNESISGYSPDGQPLLDSRRPRLKADFQQGGLAPHEVQKALDTFQFRGLAEGVTPESRLSWFDSEWAQAQFGWSDEDREFVEQKMLHMPGRHNVDYVVCETPEEAAPWPKYGQVSSPSRIAQMVQELGLDIEGVLHYERNHANREEVIEELTKLRDAAPEPDESVVVSA